MGAWQPAGGAPAAEERCGGARADGAVRRLRQRQRQRRVSGGSLARRWQPSLKGDIATQAAMVLMLALNAVIQVRQECCLRPCNVVAPFSFRPTQGSPHSRPRSGAKGRASPRGCSQPLQPQGMQACCWRR